MLRVKRAAVCRRILFNGSSVLSDGPFALFMLCTVLWWWALMPRSSKTERLGFDFMDFPHNCGSLWLSFNDIAALMSVPNEPAVSRMNPTRVSSAPGCCFRKRQRDFAVFFSFYSNHSSICVSCLFPVCQPGFYKSTLGNTECSKCPPHSFAHHEGSLFCGCEKNYFRAEGDPVAMACTRKFAFLLT